MTCLKSERQKKHTQHTKTNKKQNKTSKCKALFPWGNISYRQRSMYSAFPFVSVKITAIPLAMWSTECWGFFLGMHLCTLENYCLFIRTGELPEEIKKKKTNPNPIPSVIATCDSSRMPVARAYLRLLEAVQISEQVPFLVSQKDLATHLELCVSSDSQPATLRIVN